MAGRSDAQRTYAEWAPPAPLRHAVACLWSGVAQPGTVTLVLPDACSDLIWEQGHGAYVAGPDTGPVPAAMPAGTVVAGVRFRPAAGGPVLGLPLSELQDQRVDLADLLPAEARRLPGTLDPEQAAAVAVDLVGRLVSGSEPDTAIAHAASLLRDPRALVEDAASAAGLSMRQLRRRCHDAVGYGPKMLQRVLRFRGFVDSIDAGERDLAAIAAAVGYADQAHLTRECTSLAGLTPTALIRTRGAR
jgi:AraC-like DNA-binding protein